jgi:hypothetical protein
VENQYDNVQHRPRIVETYGAILANGVVIDLVTTASGDQLNLLRWDGQNYEIGLQFQDGSSIYCPPSLHSSLLGATWFAREPAEYGEPRQLFWKLVDLFRRYLGFSRELAAFLTQIVFCSWFPDCGPCPITLCISGMNMAQVMKLFRLLHALCRRPIVVARLSLSLPLILSPTLLINDQALSARDGERWRTSNYRGVFIAGARGTMRNIACSKIVFCETEAAREVWGTEALHIPLLPTSQKLPPLTERDEAQIAGEYQRQIFMFRLHHLSVMQQSIISSCQPRSAGFEVGENLPACIAEDPEIMEALTPILDAREQQLRAWRALDPHAVIVEVIWAPSHREKEMSTAEITKRVNALLHERGEMLRYNPSEIGWKLTHLGLSRRHNGKRKVVPFSREVRRRIHELAAQFGQQPPKVAGCEECKGSQLIGLE